MGEEISRARLEYATEIFLAEMRRRFAAAFPGQENPVRALEAYHPSQRSDLMGAIRRAIQSSTPEADVAFQNWLAGKGR